MTKTLKTIVLSAVAAALLSAPATAGGSISLTYAPTDAKDAQVLSTGLALYSIFNGMKANGGHITQDGFNNLAGIAQNGGGNLGVLEQHGNGHVGTIEQNGNNNSCGLFQFGEATEGHCVQNGNDQSSATVQIGF